MGTKNSRTTKSTSPFGSQHVRVLKFFGVPKCKRQTARIYVKNQAAAKRFAALIEKKSKNKLTPSEKKELRLMKGTDVQVK